MNTDVILAAVMGGLIALMLVCLIGFLAIEWNLRTIRKEKAEATQKAAREAAAQTVQDILTRPSVNHVVPPSLPPAEPTRLIH